MDMKLGTKLIELRKKKGLTQEQLAEQLGVSAPAVSKWENDASYPDITILCPLARALNTNVDTLLQFEEELTDRDITEKMNAIIEATRQSGYETGEKMTLELLRSYPNSIALKFHAAAICDVFQMFFPASSEETKSNWRNWKKELLTEVRSSETGAYWQAATSQLANIAISENKLEYAEQLLKELPEHTAEPTIAWAQLYLKKEEPEEALKTIQKRLFSLVQQVQTCLALLLNPSLLPDNEQQLSICEVYKTVDTLFGLSGMYDGLFLEVYFRMNRWEDAADCLEHYADALTGERVLPKRFLFSPGLDIKEGQEAASKELRRLLLNALEEEPYQPLLESPKGKAAIEKLKASL